MGLDIRFYWDIGSTNSYFALHLIRPLAERYKARLLYRPFNLGYVFRRHNYVLMDEPAAKIANRKRDLERWNARHGLAFRFPDRFPIKTSRALRASIAARSFGAEEAFIETLFRRYWEENDASIADQPALVAIATGLGADPGAFAAACDSAETRAALAHSTDEGLAIGVFGAPSFVIGEELYWGKDRMDFIEAHLRALSPGSASAENGENRT